DRLHLAALGVELDHEVLDAQQHVVVGPQVRGAGASHYADTVPVSTPASWLRARASAPSGVPTGNQQRNSWPGTTPARSGGCSSRQRSCAYAHRAANRQPVGRSTRSGGRPGIAVRRVWLGSPLFGVGRRNAPAYGILTWWDSGAG